MEATHPTTAGGLVTRFTRVARPPAARSLPRSVGARGVICDGGKRAAGLAGASVGARGSGAPDGWAERRGTPAMGDGGSQGLPEQKGGGLLARQDEGGGWMRAFRSWPLIPDRTSS